MSSYAHRNCSYHLSPYDALTIPLTIFGSLKVVFQEFSHWFNFTHKKVRVLMQPRGHSFSPPHTWLHLMVPGSGNNHNQLPSSFSICSVVSSPCVFCLAVLGFILPPSGSIFSSLSPNGVVSPKCKWNRSPLIQLLVVTAS